MAPYKLSDYINVVKSTDAGQPMWHLFPQQSASGLRSGRRSSDDFALAGDRKGIWPQKL